MARGLRHEAAPGPTWPPEWEQKRYLGTYLLYTEHPRESQRTCGETLPMLCASPLNQIKILDKTSYSNIIGKWQENHIKIDTPTISRKAPKAGLRSWAVA